MSRTKPLWPGIIELFPAMESLVSDIPAGDGKSRTYFTVHACLIIITDEYNVLCVGYCTEDGGTDLVLPLYKCFLDVLRHQR